MKFVIIPELRGRWSWELRDAEGCAVSRSTGSYMDRVQAQQAIQRLRRDVLGARVLGPTGTSLDDLMAALAPNTKTSE